MPRPLLAALVAAGLLGTIGVASIVAFYALALDWRPPLPPRLSAMWILGATLLLVAAWRRNGPAARVMFWGALGVAILLGTAGTPLMATIAVLDPSPASLALLLLVLVLVALHAVVAYGLSRPASKEWFRRGAGREAPRPAPRS